MELQEDIEAIYSKPAFVDAVLELLGLSEVEIETPLPEESGEEEETRAIDLRVPFSVSPLLRSAFTSSSETRSGSSRR